MKFSIKTASTQYLLIGYIALFILFGFFWALDTNQIDEQSELIETADLAAKKMRTIAEMIQIVRDRVRLVHEMISIEDVFEKDDVFQEIEIKATRFALKQQEFLSMSTTEQETKIIASQREIYPFVSGLLEDVLELTLLESTTSDRKARDIVIHQIVPKQEIVIDGLMHIMQDIQKEISITSKSSLKSYEDNANYRLIIVFLMFIASLIILIWVMSRMLMIEGELVSISLTDGLTSIPNRRCFDENFSQEWNRALRAKTPLSLLLIDIDFFKKYNDFYGHQAGDDCLIQVAQVIRDTTHRSNDKAARYGGEEFAIILPGTDESGAEKFANRLINKIEALNIEHEKSDVGKYVTISVGVATVVPQIGSNSESLIRAADAGLYAAKEGGRNKVSIHLNS